MVTKTTVQDPISPDLKRIMRQLKLGRMLDTLPERLTLARQQHLSHVAFLELVLADEAIRRDTHSAARLARTAGLDPAMRLDTWDESAAVRYDHTCWTELTSAASMATSVPVPMARPTSAWARAGASLMPSPTMPTRRPSACSRRISPAYRLNTIPQWLARGSDHHYRPQI